MKTIQRSLLTALLGVAATTAVQAQATTTDITEPKGSLSATEKSNLETDRAKLTWSIKYPSSVKDAVVVGTNDTVTAKEDLLVDVRVLGMSYQISDTKWGNVTAGYQVNDGTWVNFVSTTQNKIDPAKNYVNDLALPAGAKLDFHGRGNNGSQDLPWRETGSATTPQNVVALVNGDAPPTTTPAFSQGRIEDFLKPVLGPDKKIKIGPRDVIYLIEIGQTDTRASGFDLQDLVLLVTYNTDNTKLKNNNGHGNNIDGVDSSNPGQGKGGPNGKVDSDPNVDDEGR